jgi:ActR/RegA family two-component response regulator
MKTIRTIATIMLAAFLVLGPVAALAATSTMTIGTNSASYSGMADVTVSGTISPAPTIASNVVITTTGPVGAVDIESVPVATGTGTFTYTLVTGGNANWVSGTYTVNGTWGAQGNTASKTTTFAYTATGTGSGSTTTVTVASTTTTVTTTVTTAEATTTVTSSDAAALSSIQTSLAGITSSIAVLTTGYNSLNTAVGTLTTDVSALSTVPSSLSTISAAVTNIQQTLTSLGTGLTSVANMPAQLTSLTNAVNTNQTYVLVVAALAAITLVLELAILVRKLS